VTQPFRIALAGANFGLGVQVSESTDLSAAVAALGLPPPRPTVVVVGGAASLDDARIDALRPMFTTGIAPVMQRFGAVGIDGGTPFGVMRLFGEARAAATPDFPLVGVVATGPVQLPHGKAFTHAETALDAHHTHFVIVPGDNWGDEAPWIARAATVLAGTAPSITVLIGGGRIAYSDVHHSVEAGRRVLVVAGSGGTADALADAVAGRRASPLIESGLIRVVRADQPNHLAELLTEVLG
jgi:SLOG in TRPM, prokaryote